MNIKHILIVILATSVLYGCKSDTTSASAAATEGMSLPANVVVIPDSTATSANLAAFNAAFDDSGTDYSKAPIDVWINAGDWQDPMNMADMLICIMNATGADKVPNGTYAALVDMSQCGDEQGGSQAAKVTRYASATVIAARASSTANQTVTAYFLDGQDQNDDGVISDAEDGRYAANVTMSESASTTNPFGAFDFNWNRTDAASDGSTGDYERGSLSFTTASTTQAGISFIEQLKDAGNSEDHSLWAKGMLNKDGSGGKLKVVNGSTSPEKVYKINFNATHAHIDTDGTAVCKNLADNTMTTYAYSYNLYNATTGALIDIVAGIELVYGTDKDKRGYVGSYWEENSGGIKLWMWTEDGSKPTTVYKESDKETALSVSWFGRTPTISSGLTLEEPINFTDSFTALTPAGVSGTRTNNLVYEGPGQLWGIPWTNNSGKWSPNFNLADGDTLIGRGGSYDGVSYKVKRTGAWRTLDTASGACGSLSVANSEFSAFTAPTLTAVSTTWASKPVVTDKAKIIHGVLQF